MLQIKWISAILISAVIHIYIYFLFNHKKDCDRDIDDKMKTDKDKLKIEYMIVCQNKTINYDEVKQEKVKHSDEIKTTNTDPKEQIHKKDSVGEVFNTNKTKMQIVPNIVHYIWLDMKKNLEFSFLNAVSFTSVKKNWKPDKIFLHVFEKHYPRGTWWDYVERTVKGIYLVEHNMTELKIYGVVPKHVEHMSDILRINILQEHGGIYIDTDVLALRSIEPLRQYDHTQGVGMKNDGLSNAVIIAKKESTLLDLWKEAYRTYGTFDNIKHDNYTLWSYYSIKVPSILYNLYPHLMHGEWSTLVKPVPKRYMEKKYVQQVWENNYSIHVWHRALTVPNTPEEIQSLQSESLLRQAMEYIWFDKKP